MAQPINAGFTVEDSKFEAGGVYSFMSVRDNEWIDICLGQLTDGTKIRMWPGNGLWAQKWRVELDDEDEVPRGHMICTIGSADLKRVLTLKSHHQNDKVVLEEYKGKLEQLWFYIPLASTGKFAIVNAYNGKTLSNQGHEENLRCIGIDPDDTNQQFIHVKA